MNINWTTVLALLTVFLFNSGAQAGLVINAAEMGIGKFHRKDNSVRDYKDENVWKIFVLSNSVTPQTKTPIVEFNADGSYTIFFSHLHELLKAVVKLSKDTGFEVSELNLNAHGMPGGTWFPKDEADMNSAGCKSWVSAASKADDKNYKQYYTPISKKEVMDNRKFSQTVGGQYECIVGIDEWKDELKKVAAFKTVLAPEFQMHFLSCTVGLGARGDVFAKGLAKAMFTTSKQKIQTSMQFGLGDWSIPEGMSFWDYQNDEQLKHDNQVYVVDLADRPQMQKGDIRVTSLLAGKPTSGLINNVDFMYLIKDDRQPIPVEAAEAVVGTAPQSISIPGTGITASKR